MYYSIRKTGQYNIEQSQKAIELEHMKIQLELTNAETSELIEEMIIRDCV